jgi:hypothetical protein
MPCAKGASPAEGPPAAPLVGGAHPRAHTPPPRFDVRALARSAELSDSPSDGFEELFLTQIVGG